MNYAYDRDTAFERLDKARREKRLFNDARAGVEAALARSARDRHVVVGKLLGTLAMAQLMVERRLPTGARTVWLTPLLADERVRSALEALDQPGLVVIGDQDPHFDPPVFGATAPARDVPGLAAGRREPCAQRRRRYCRDRFVERYLAALERFLASADTA